MHRLFGCVEAREVLGQVWRALYFRAVYLVPLSGLIIHFQPLPCPIHLLFPCHPLLKQNWSGVFWPVMNRP